MMDYKVDKQVTVTLKMDLGDLYVLAKMGDDVFREVYNKMPDGGFDREQVQRMRDIQETLNQVLREASR